ncbi:hypothetical protein B2J93_7746 [Marssonina coronariae]|uniref:Uncharacterized protein n=1 Tax=Diplocarpon coronariae TaxID=2795749 RepID=A0A218ZGZ5_9HELO|nr:hypothetical protein B2J93_7746 [Marssonina coronariae]
MHTSPNTWTLPWAATEYSARTSTTDAKRIPSHGVEGANRKTRGHRSPLLSNSLLVSASGQREGEALERSDGWAAEKWFVRGQGFLTPINLLIFGPVDPEFVGPKDLVVALCPDGEDFLTRRIPSPFSHAESQHSTIGRLRLLECWEAPLSATSCCHCVLCPSYFAGPNAPSQSHGSPPPRRGRVVQLPKMPSPIMVESRESLAGPGLGLALMSKQDDVHLGIPCRTRYPVSCWSSSVPARTPTLLPRLSPLASRLSPSQLRDLLIPTVLSNPSPCPSQLGREAIDKWCPAQLPPDQTGSTGLGIRAAPILGLTTAAAMSRCMSKFRVAEILPSRPPVQK